MAIAPEPTTLPSPAGGLVSAGTAGLIGSATNLLTFGVQSYFNERGRRAQMRELKRERDRQRKLDTRNFAFQQQQVKFSQDQSSRQERLGRQQFGLGKEAQEFNMDQTLRQNRIDDFQGFLSNIMANANNNSTLRQSFAEKGYL